MTGPRFTRAEIEKRRERVSELFLQGKTLAQIGQEVGVTASQVCHDIKAIRLSWRSRTDQNIEEKQRLELARLDQIENEAWRGWNRTIGVHKTTRQELEAGGSKEAPKKKLVTTSEKLAGDPRFLSVITSCIEQRSKILGLTSPLELRLQGRLSIHDLREILDTPDDVNEEDQETIQ